MRLQTVGALLPSRSASSRWCSAPCNSQQGRCPALAAQCQQPSRRTRSPVGGLPAGLRDLGYVEGQNILIESRYAESQEDRLPALAAELVRLPVDVLVAAGTTAIQAAQHATTTIPIVMVVAVDAVAQGFVASLARPGGISPA